MTASRSRWIALLCVLACALGGLAWLMRAPPAAVRPDLGPGGGAEGQPSGAAAEGAEASWAAELESLPLPEGRVEVGIPEDAREALLANQDLHPVAVSLLEGEQIFRDAARIEVRQRVRRGAKWIDLPAREHAWSGSQDALELQLPTGEWWISANAPGRASESVLAPVPLEHGPLVRITLRETCEYSGLVLAPDDAPAEGVIVELLVAGRALASTRTAAGGGYRLEGLARAGTSLAVGDPCRPAAVIDPLPACAGALRIDPVRLPECGELRLSIDRLGLEGLPVRVLLQHADSGRSWHEFDPHDELRVRHLLPGRYRAFVWVADHRGNREVTIAAGAAQPFAVALRRAN
ncbi:MAG: carboxypeptidase regulatory-like domain-containing protein [Planctomycetes bacterium]|nr:carboxypeptidase regulatory-like domain-containing protein [Planctomycetota bacterium]